MRPEAVLITALLLADLAVPPQALQALLIPRGLQPISMFQLQFIGVNSREEQTCRSRNLK